VIDQIDISARADEGSGGAPPVPPEQEPGEPNETTTGGDVDEGADKGADDSEEARVDAAPQEIP
jgi:hypothetical protein